MAPWRAGPWLASVELALIVALVAGDFYGFVPVTSTPFFLALGWVSLRLRGLRWRDVGLARPRTWMPAVALGIVAGVAMEVFSTYVTVPFLSRATGALPDLSDFRPMVGNIQVLLMWMILNWTLGAFGEELAYRGYVMNRIADLGRRTPAVWVASLVVTSALFGWGHGSGA